MKKILFSLVALVCSMSMNAQVVKLYKGETLVATYPKSRVDRVVFEEEQMSGYAEVSTGTGKYGQAWRQLWEDGPKFATANVNTYVITDISYNRGGYYCWGMSQHLDKNATYKEGSAPLTGTDDTATKLWGSKWRMPTSDEFRALLQKCDAEWTTIDGNEGCKFTGRGKYSSNYIFLPAAGIFDIAQDNVGAVGRNSYGAYWTSSPTENSTQSTVLIINSTEQNLGWYPRRVGVTIRAVLAE